MKIYIDFDRTLFDTNRFLAELYNLFRESGVNIEQFDKIRKESSIEGFNCYQLLTKLKKTHPFNENIYLKVERFMECVLRFLYQDAEVFLQKAREMNYEIILLTKGNKEFQKEKIRYTFISKYLDGIIVTLIDKGDLNIDYQNGIFIDDSVYEIESILKRNPRRVICINRDNKEKRISDEKVVVVESLKEILDKKLI